MREIRLLTELRALGGGSRTYCPPFPRILLRWVTTRMPLAIRGGGIASLITPLGQSQRLVAVVACSETANDPRRNVPELARRRLGDRIFSRGVTC